MQSIYNKNTVGRREAGRQAWCRKECHTSLERRERFSKPAEPENRPSTSKAQQQCSAAGRTNQRVVRYFSLF